MGLDAPSSLTRKRFPGVPFRRTQSPAKVVSVEGKTGPGRQAKDEAKGDVISRASYEYEPQRPDRSQRTRRPG